MKESKNKRESGVHKRALCLRESAVAFAKGYGIGERKKEIEARRS